VEKEFIYKIYYRDKQIGHYSADIVVANQVIVELKAVDTLLAAHRAQLLNYLRVSKLPVGLLFNFGRPKLEVKRVIL
jgi:GxxExxY protein